MEKQRIEEIAANRLKLISPLLDTALDRDKKQMMKEQLCIQTGLSERTIRRYLNLYQEKGQWTEREHCHSGRYSGRSH